MAERKIAVVTGSNAGIGAETSRGLSLQGYHVIMAARNTSNADDTVKSWPDVGFKHDTVSLPLDLSDLKSVKKFAKKIKKTYTHIDALVLNAGISPDRYSKSAQGFEIALAVNHIGHFYLTHLLLDLVKAAPQGRIVVLSSNAQEMFDLNDLNRKDLENTTVYGAMQKLKLYSQTKAMNILFAKHLARLLKEENSSTLRERSHFSYTPCSQHHHLHVDVIVNAVHPGFVSTPGSSKFMPLGFLWRFAVKLFSKSTEDGARTPIFAASSPAAAGYSGEYLVNDKPTAPMKQLLDPQLASDLWAATVKLLADAGFPVK